MDRSFELRAVVSIFLQQFLGCEVDSHIVSFLSFFLCLFDVFISFKVWLYLHTFLCFSDSWQNHHLTSKYDFHSYMIRSMEEEFQRIVGVRYLINSYILDSKV